MNPSLSSSPVAGVVTATVSVAAPGGGSNLQLHQPDSGSSRGFGAMLRQAGADLSASEEMSPDTERLFGQLQDLPLDGKALPLLRQALDRVAASGGDLEQFVQRLTARLKTLTQQAERTPVEQLTLALQQLGEEFPALKPVVPADALAATARVEPTPPKANEPDQTMKSQNPQANVDHRSDRISPELRQAAQQPFQSAPVNTGAPSPAGALWSQLQPPAESAEKGAADIAMLTAALKRLSADNRTSSSAVLPRADAFSTSVATAPATQVATAHAAPTVNVNTPVAQAGWDEALGERIQWLASHKVQGAQVRLNPANLGPMEVRIQVHNDQASIQFTAHHAVVREALEAALPRLRDMFESSGVQLVNVDVSSGQSFSEQQAARDLPGKDWGNSFDTSEPEPVLIAQTPLAAFTARGRLDLFA